jgi:pantothenate kinase
MSEKHEMVFEIPAELISGFRGLSIDIGGSLMKFAYRGKEDKRINAGNQKPNTGRLHLVSFPKGEMKQALEYVRERADITRDGLSDTTTICSTGVGCAMWAASICEAFNVQLQNVSEFDCNVRSFYYLAHRLTRDQLIERFDYTTVTESIAEARGMRLLADMAIAAGMSRAKPSTGQSFDELTRRFIERSGDNVEGVGGREAGGSCGSEAAVPMAEAEPDMFPCMLVACGSGTMFSLIEKDGEFQIVDVLNRGGSSFLGLGNLILGVKTFTELIELASKGDNRNVDSFSDFMSTSKAFTKETNDLYHAMGSATSYLQFSFGHAIEANKGDLKSEDIALALLSHIVRDLLQSLVYLCQAHGIRRIFMLGGLCNHPFVRRVITAEFIIRTLTQRVFVENDQYIEIDFVKASAYIGAIGCAINDTEKFI